MVFRHVGPIVLSVAAMTLLPHMAQGQQADCSDSVLNAAQLPSLQASCDSANALVANLGVQQTAQVKAARKKFKKDKTKLNQKLKKIRKSFVSKNAAATAAAQAACQQYGDAKTAHDALLQACHYVLDDHINSGTEDPVQKAIFVQEAFTASTGFYAQQELTKRVTYKLSPGGWAAFNDFVNNDFWYINRFAINDINRVGVLAGVVPDMGPVEEQMIGNGATGADRLAQMATYADAIKNQVLTFELKADDVPFNDVQKDVVRRYWTDVITAFQDGSFLPNVGSAPIRLVEVLSPGETSFHFRCSSDGKLFVASFPSDVGISTDTYDLPSAFMNCTRKVQ